VKPLNEKAERKMLVKLTSDKITTFMFSAEEGTEETSEAPEFSISVFGELKKDSDDVNR
jgi:hypothetical protein